MRYPECEPRREKMSVRRLIDPAWECFQPLATLQFHESAPLMCRCLGLWEHWVNLNRLGPMMTCSDLNRAILIDSGLPLTVQLNGELAENSILQKLQKQFQNNQNNAASGISLARLLISMGCHLQAKNVLSQIQHPYDLRLKLWIDYLALVQRNAKCSDKDAEILWLAIQGSMPPYGPETILLGFTVLRKLRSCYLKIKHFLIQAIEVSLLDERERFLVLARLYRLDSELHETSNHSRHAKELLDLSFSSLGSAEKLITASWHKHLCLETKRRVLEYAYHLAIRQKNETDAYNFANQMVILDPQCARAHLLAGEICLKLNFKEKSIEHLQQASVLGVLEKPYANFLLTKNCSERFKEHYLAKAIRSVFFRKDISCIKQTKVFPSSMEIEDLVKNAYIERENIDFKQRFLADNLLNCFAFYWLSEHVDNETRPMCAELPKIAWKIFKACPEPYFVTHGVQRALVNGFRKELLHASNGWRWVSEEQFTQFFKWCALINDSEKISLASNFSNENPLAKAYFARYLAIMGFFNEAAELLRPFAFEKNSSIEMQFVSTVYLWILHFSVTPSESAQFLQQLSSLYEMLSDCSETLRMRSTISILGTVISAKMGSLADCESWRIRAIETLQLIQKCPLFSLGDQRLLESRIFRAISYFPFISGNHKQLLHEQEHFLRLAYEISDHFTGEKEVIFRDNLFAALESSARVYEKLNRWDDALTCMKEIVEKVDRFDSKAWLQVGELYRKVGKISEALDSFLKAATIGAPHAQISYYSAGRCAEQLNDLSLAKDLFLQSALAFPGGISPLLRLSKLCETLNDQHLKEWALSNLNQLKLKPKDPLKGT